jgi:hypothetical protein
MDVHNGNFCLEDPTANRWCSALHSRDLRSLNNPTASLIREKAMQNACTSTKRSCTAHNQASRKMSSFAQCGVSVLINNRISNTQMKTLNQQALNWRRKINVREIAFFYEQWKKPIVFPENKSRYYVRGPKDTILSIFFVQQILLHPNIKRWRKKVIT